MSDPFETSRFLVFLGPSTTPVPGITRVSGLSRSTAAIDESSGGDRGAPRLAPGRTAYAPITLSRGVDADTTFEDWANAVFELSDQGVASGGQNFRKSVRIELLDEAGQLVLAYDVFNAWVSQYTALPDLNSSANAIAIEEITLEHDGWARDTSVVPPAQTS